MKVAWQDREDRYGRITRLMHWTMALLFGWQFMGMIVKIVVGRSPLTAFLVGTHRPVGLVLLALCIVRIVWALYNWRQRPPQADGLGGLFARLGHLALYALMLVIPSLALLRQAGSGKAFSFLGIPISTNTGVEIGWMTAPANLLHGVLAWCLLALVFGHVIMVLVHRYYLKDGTLSRMVGAPATPSHMTPSPPGSQAGEDLATLSVGGFTAPPVG